MSKIILMDWQRGKIPYFELPPDYKAKEGTINNIEEVDKNKEVIFS
jgi:ribosome biogenesis GTPase A